VKIRHLAASAVLVAAATASAAAPVAAAPVATNSARFISHVKIDKKDPTIGTVQVQYRCTGGASTLWVSVKQTADRTADPRLAHEGSSQISAAWSQSHRNPVTCDGKLHTGTFTVDHVEYGFGTLQRGKGYVQFCVSQGTEEDGRLVISESQFVDVK
jgi:hypothetical protein